MFKSIIMFFVYGLRIAYYSQLMIMRLNILKSFEIFNISKIGIISKLI